jgi:uncharacterized protein (DUF736 family)
MSNFTHQAGNGTAFVNRYKDNDKKPDYRGSITLPDGTIQEVAIWKGMTNAGDEKLSIKLSEPREKKQEAPAPARAQADHGDEIPF